MELPIYAKYIFLPQEHHCKKGRSFDKLWAKIFDIYYNLLDDNSQAESRVLMRSGCGQEDNLL